MGIGPTWLAWKARALPLCYTRTVRNAGNLPRRQPECNPSGETLGEAILLVVLQLLRRFTRFEIQDQAIWKVAELMAKYDYPKRYMNTADYARFAKQQYDEQREVVDQLGLAKKN